MGCSAGGSGAWDTGAKSRGGGGGGRSELLPELGKHAGTRKLMLGSPPALADFDRWDLHTGCPEKTEPHTRGLVELQRKRNYRGGRSGLWSELFIPLPWRLGQTKLPDLHHSARPCLERYSSHVVAECLVATDHSLPKLVSQTRGVGAEFAPQRLSRSRHCPPELLLQNRCLVDCRDKKHSERRNTLPLL